MRKNYSREEIYPYLIQSLHSTKSAEEFFDSHRDDERLLSTLLEVALADESDDARMEASFWVSQFAADLLEPFKENLKRLSQDGWESVAKHARIALKKIDKIEAYQTAL
jgi:hypothetical protein